MGAERGICFACGLQIKCRTGSRCGAQAAVVGVGGEGNEVYLFVQFVFNLNNLYNPPPPLNCDSLFIKASPYYLA